MRYSICIVEDDMVSQFATRYCLNQFSKDEFEITAHESAENALDAFMLLLEQGMALPDIIFLDLTMGGMDGWTFLDNLQVLCDGNKPPEVYILSAFSNVADRQRAKEHELIAGYFDKPLTKANLTKVFDAQTIQ